MRGTYREQVIERRRGESFLIGDSIEIFVETVKDGQVRLRCWAPGSLSIAPRELVEDVAVENRKAALSRVPAMDELFTALEEI